MAIVAPNRSEPFTEPSGFIAGERIRRWVEGITSTINNLVVQSPTYSAVTTADSPYLAVDDEYILCTMDGNITITLPATGRVHVSRSGASNTLTLAGTVNGATNPTLSGDGSSVSLAYIGTEFRYV